MDDDPSTDYGYLGTRAVPLIDKPRWASFARPLVASLTMSILATTSQTYITKAGDERREEATMVKLTFGDVNALHKMGQTMIVTLTKATGASNEINGATLHMLEHQYKLADPPFQIQPVLVANLSGVELNETAWFNHHTGVITCDENYVAEGSFLIRSGDRLVVKALNQLDGMPYISKSMAKTLGNWHLELIITVVQAFVEPNSVETLGAPGGFVFSIQKCVKHGRVGAIGGVPMIGLHCPLVHWHPQKDGKSVDGLETSKPNGKVGKRKKRNTSSEKEQATDILRNALSALGIQLTAPPRVNSNISKDVAAKAKKAVASSLSIKEYIATEALVIIATERVATGQRYSR